MLGGQTWVTVKDHGVHRPLTRLAGEKHWAQSIICDRFGKYSPCYLLQSVHLNLQLILNVVSFQYGLQQ